MHWYGTHLRHWYAGVLCPCCGAYSSVSDVPDAVWENVKDKKSVFDGFDDRI
jgi:hypothetical protein